MMGWYGGMGMGGWLFMGVLWVALLALVVWLVIRLLPSGNRSTGSASVESPEDILDRRFARGEIDDETYAAQRATLAEHRAAG